METNRLIACAHRLHILQVIYITFNPGNDSITGLRRLIGLTRSNPHIKIEPSGGIVPLLAVMQDGDWQRVSRTVAVHGLIHAGDDFLESIARDVEKVAVSDHGAKGLFTSRERNFVEVAALITKAVMTPDLCDEVKAWGLNLFSDPRMVMEDDLPGIKFTVQDMDYNVLLTVKLDGWSGRMAVNDLGWGNVAYTQPIQLQFLIRSNLEQCVERMTQPKTA
jgi:hypothetical protein